MGDEEEWRMVRVEPRGVGLMEESDGAMLVQAVKNERGGDELSVTMWECCVFVDDGRVFSGNSHTDI